MKVLRIRRAARKGDRVLVHAEGQEPFELARDVIERSGIRVGVELGSVDLARLREDDTKWRVRQTALHLLSYRPRAEHELRARLRAKGFPPALVEWCIHRLRELGLLDDRAFASAHVRSRMRLRPRGRSKLKEELRQKGVVAHIADEVIAEAFLEEETSEEALAMEAARSWVERQGRVVARALSSDRFSEERERSRRRLHALLSRRGFDPDAIRSALAAAVERAAEV